MIDVEVIHATPAEQQVCRLRLRDGATVDDALSADEVAESFDADDLRLMKVGIFGRVVERSQRLSDGDRIEIYRPLLADPKLARRRRVAASRRR